MKKQAGMGQSIGSEQSDRFVSQTKSREETRAETDILFDSAKRSRIRNVAEMKKLFVQAPAAQSMAPGLQKESAAKNVEAFFEKLAGTTQAQKNFPELLKVADQGPRPTVKQTQIKKGDSIPSQPMGAGGQA